MQVFSDEGSLTNIETALFLSFYSLGIGLTMANNSSRNIY